MEVKISHLLIKSKRKKEKKFSETDSFCSHAIKKKKIEIEKIKKRVF